MLSYMLILLYILILSVDAVFIKSRVSDTWENAREYCTGFGGQLATLNDIGKFRDDVRRREITLSPGEELWVGASLKHGPWTWKGETELVFKDKHFVRKGCLSLDTENSGTWIDALTPMKCLDHCGWSGQVGLKESYCYCTEDLGNVSSSSPGVCHIRCNSTTSHMCGGYSAISLYKPGLRDLQWAEGEPNDDNDCTLLRVGGKTTPPELVTGNCDMQTRYLCSFSDNDKCGFQNECVRASAFYSTWSGANNKCADINGTFSQLQEPVPVDMLNDLYGLPRGSFWVALHRSRHWQWLDGQLVDPTSFHAGRRFVHSQTCATVKMIGNGPTLTGSQCQQRLHFICQYDYMKKRQGYDQIGLTPDVMGAGVTPAYGIMSDDAGTGYSITTDDNLPEKASKSGGMYMILGFVSGMVCVLILGLIVYLICRCRQPSDENKHERLDGRPTRSDNQSVSYSSKDDSIHISAPVTDNITYDTVYDLETESPFRRTQRLIRMGSANSWRHAPTRLGTDPNTTPSPRTGYTWRGVVGGGIEIINTELRHPVTDQSDYREASTASLYDGASYNRTRAIIENRRGSSPNEFDEIEVLYDLPERSDSFDYESRKTQRDRTHEESGASFLEIRTARNSGTEENIYATIKKQFQKIEEEIAEQARKDTVDNPDKNK